MPDATGQMVEFFSEDTDQLLFSAKLYFVPVEGQTVEHNGDTYKVERVNWMLIEDPRIQYCKVAPQVFLSEDVGGGHHGGGHP